VHRIARVQRNPASALDGHVRVTSLRKLACAQVIREALKVVLRATKGPGPLRMFGIDQSSADASGYARFPEHLLRPAVWSVLARSASQAQILLQLAALASKPTCNWHRTGHRLGAYCAMASQGTTTAACPTPRSALNQHPGESSESRRPNRRRAESEHSGYGTESDPATPNPPPPRAPPRKLPAARRGKRKERNGSCPHPIGTAAASLVFGDRQIEQTRPAGATAARWRVDAASKNVKKETGERATGRRPTIAHKLH